MISSTIARRICIRMASSSSSPGSLRVQHSPDQNEFFVALPETEVKAVLKYEKETPSVLNLYSTVVPKEFEGKGIAKLLAKEAMEYCRVNNFKMRLTCWYLDGYLQRNPDERYLNLVVKD